MIATLPVTQRRSHFNKWLLFFSGAYLLAAILLLRDYMDIHALNFQMGIAALCVCIYPDVSRKGHTRYGFAALFMVALTYWIPVKSFVYISLVMGILFAIESLAGKLNTLPLMVTGCMTPIAEYLSQVFSFPIRLQLSSWSGWLLRKGGVPVTTGGNTIYYQGAEFTVDPACMGLHMLIASLLAGMMLVAMISKKQGKQISTRTIITILVSILGFNIIANILRITTLVYFQCLPGTWMHDLIGMLYFMAYVIAPAFILIQTLVKRFGKIPLKPTTIKAYNPTCKSILINSILISLIIFVCVFRLNLHSYASDITPMHTLKDYKITSLADNITKLENPNALIYIKPIRGFYASDHNPTICWTGSGYVFKQVTQQTFKGGEIFKAILVKDSALLYTAWWYDSGSAFTISQYSWRWDALRYGHQYAIINITAVNKEALDQTILQFRNDPTHRHFIHSALPKHAMDQ